MSEPSELKRLYWRLLAARRSLLLPLRRAIAPHRVRHLAGPSSTAFKPEDLVVVCMVRDGEPWAGEFVDHYRSKGATHLVFLDNGSVDDTKDIIREAGDGITLMETTLSFLEYQEILKDWMARTFSGDAWVLVADIDEFFDYPFSSAIGVPGLLRYLNEAGYSDVLVQMLDMYSDQSPGDPLGHFLDDCLYYETESIRKQSIEKKLLDYGSISSNPRVQQHYGGVQERIFGTPLLLSKMSMFRPSAGVRLTNNHWCENARLADFSCVVRHFKFVGGLHARAVDAVHRNNHWAGSMHYRNVKRVMEGDRAGMVSTISQRWNGVDQLVDDGFLVVSDEYREKMTLDRRFADKDV